MLKFLLGLIITLIGIPLLLLFLLIDFSPDIPYDVYEVSSVEAIMEEELNDAIAGIQGGELALSLKQDNLNNIIYNAIIENEEFASYAPGEDCEDIECEFIQYEVLSDMGTDAYVGITGVWVEFFDDIISLNVSVKGKFYVGFTTSMELQFEVLDNDDTYTVSYEKVKVGNLPLPKGIVRPIVNLVVEQMDIDTSELNSEDYMEVDLSTLTVTFPKDEIAAQVAAEDPSAQAYLNLVLENQLVRMAVFEEEPRFEVYVDVNKMVADSQVPDYLVGFEGDFDIATEINEEMNRVMLSALGGSPSINITEETINKVIASAIGAMNITDLMSQSEDTELDVDITFDGVWVEFMDDMMEMNIQMTVGGESLLFELNTLVTDESGDLVFTINAAYLGRDPGEAESNYITFDSEEIKVLLANLEADNELMNFDLANGRLVIPRAGLTSQIEGESMGVSLGDIKVIDGMISIAIILPDQELLDAVVEEVQEVFESFEDGMDFIDDTVPEEVAFEEKVQEIAASMDVTTGQVPTEEQVEELAEAFYELSEETQEEFIEEIMESVDEETLNALLDSFMQTQ